MHDITSPYRFIRTQMSTKLRSSPVKQTRPQVGTKVRTKLPPGSRRQKRRQKRRQVSVNHHMYHQHIHHVTVLLSGCPVSYACGLHAGHGHRVTVLTDIMHDITPPYRFIRTQIKLRTKVSTHTLAIYCNCLRRPYVCQRRIPKKRLS